MKKLLFDGFSLFCLSNLNCMDEMTKEHFDAMKKITKEDFEKFKTAWEETQKLLDRRKKEEISDDDFKEEIDEQAFVIASIQTKYNIKVVLRTREDYSKMIDKIKENFQKKDVFRKSANRCTIS
jgi:hypothetical protein